MIVLDASAVIDLLLRRDTHRSVGTLLGEHEAASVELLIPEVLHTLLRLEQRGELPPARAAEAVEDLGDLPVDLYPLGPMVHGIWDLRGDITAYDACYVALAARLDARLVTGDRRLARTAQRHCRVMAAPTGNGQS